MEAAASQKRKREPKFDSSEKLKLVEIVRKYFHIIENKRTDGSSSRLKNETWKQIGILFNGSSGVYPRNWETLKMLWENLRRKARQAITIQTENVKGTGGGVGKPVISDPVLEIVVDLIRPQVGPITNPYDCDIDPVRQECETFETQKDGHVDVIVDGMANDSANANDSFVIIEDGTMDWSHYTPSMLKTPRSVILGQNKLEGPTETTKEQPDKTIPLVTPKRVTSVAQRRRPVLKQAEAEALLQAKVSTLSSATQHSKKEHEVQMRILLLQEKAEKERLMQEKERLVQEKIKTALLRRQLLAETGSSLLEEKEAEGSETPE